MRLAQHARHRLGDLGVDGCGRGVIEIDALHVCKSRLVWPFFAAIALFVTLLLLWLGERLADRTEGRPRRSRGRLPPGPPRS
jgi:hypothetical protein